MSSEPLQPLEFFLERSLGKLTADGLREQGWLVHTIYDHFPQDGADVSDEEWISYGTEQGWICLTKDRRIRYRAAEIGALSAGHIFCLARGNLLVAEMVDRLVQASDAIYRGVSESELGFWHVYEDGQVRRMWP